MDAISQRLSRRLPWFARGIAPRLSKGRTRPAQPLRQSFDVSSRRFLFLAGLHRSGTSIVHRLLRAHPDVSGFSDTGAKEDEGQFLQSVFPIAGKFGGPGRFAFDARARLDETSDLCTDENRERLGREWSAHLDAESPVLIEKSPPNITKSRFLQAMFPKASFIFIVRHPVPVSLATRKWSKTTDAELLLHWCVAHQVMLWDLSRLHRALVIRYEDFVAEPERHMGRMLEFADLPAIALDERVEDRNGRYFAKWEEDRSCERLGLAPDLFSAIPAQFGYSLERPYVVPPPDDGPLRQGRLEALA